MTATYDQIATLVREFVVREFLNGDPGNLCDSTQLLQRGVIDSFALLSLVSFLIGQFDLQLEIAEIESEQVATIAAIASFVHGRLQTAGSTAGSSAAGEGT